VREGASRTRAGSRRAIVRSGLADQIYDALVDRVLDMAYAPGERLVIDQIAREMGVSPTPVRDALMRMAGEGFIESTPFRGFTVLPVPSVEEIEQSFEARAVIESAAVRLGCVRRTDEQLAELREVQGRIAAQHAGPRAKTYAPFGRLNQRFHQLLVGTSGNRYLEEALRSLDHDARMARTMHGRGVPDFPNIVEEHEAILEALETRDAERASAAVERHIRGGAERVLAVRRAREEAV
jgi:DNA-binding GntR family transcriptional regulator